MTTNEEKPLGAGAERSAPLELLHTRGGARGAETTSFFQEAGAIVWPTPVLRLTLHQSKATDDALAKQSGFDWVLFGSANAVTFYCQSLEKLGLSLKDGPTPVFVGPQTQAAYLGLVPKGYMAEVNSSKGMAETVLKLGKPGQRVLVPQVQGGREEATNLLSKAGFDVTAITTYRSEAAAPNDREVCDGIDRLKAGSVDIVALFSPSQVTALLLRLGEPGLALLGGCRGIVAIGATTAQAAKSAGLSVRAAEVPTLEAMLDCIKQLA